MLNARELTEEETKTLKKKASDILSVTRRDILSKYPFIGSIALRMEMIPVRDVRVRTACTDGNSVYFDIAFLSSLTREEQSFVLAHEIWHAVMMHLVRRQNRNPEIFNIATDKEVNSMLVKDGFTPPKDLLFPTKEEEGKCAEEIYEMLIKKMKKQPQLNGGGSGGMSGNSSSSNSSKSTNNKNKSSQSSSSQSNQNGNESGELTGQFDKHIYDGMEDDQDQPNKNGNAKNGGKNGNGDDEEENSNDGNGKGDGGSKPSYSRITDKYGTVGFDADYRPKVSKDFADKMRETIVSSAQRAEKTRGTLPAHIKELVKKVTAAEIPWQEVLAQFVTRCYNSGHRSWIPPNRRHVHNGLYLQSRQASKIRLACIIDTSGSTMNDRGKFLAELNSLIKSFGLFDIFIIECDAEVGAIKHYTQDDYLEQEIENGEYMMSGGGGTSMTPALNAIIEEQMEVDAVLLLTDGYIDNIPTNPTGLPTLWVITKDGTEDFCDWGQKIRLKISDNDYD